MTLRRLARLLPVLLLTLLARPAAAQPGEGFPGGFGGFPGGDPDGPKVTVDASWVEGFAAPGGTSLLAVRFAMIPGWHVQAGAGSGDESPSYIATTIALELPEGWRAGDVSWPEAHEFQLGQGEFAETLEGYEGTVAAVIPVTVPADATPGTAAVRVKVGYQACDDSVCDMPRDEVLTPTTLVAEALPDGASAASASLRALVDATLAHAPLAVAPEFAEGERLKVDVAVYEGALVPGGTANLGLVLHVRDDWYVQAGEGSGDVPEGFIATSFDLTLPEGWTTGETMWPVASEKGTYGGRSVAIVPVTPPADAAPGTYDVSATVTYQACDAIDGLCEMQAELAVRGTVQVVAADQQESIEPIDSRLAALFDATLMGGGGGLVRTDDDPAKADLPATIRDATWWTALAFIVLGMGWMLVRGVAIAKSNLARGVVAVLAVLVTLGAFSFVRGMTAESAVTWTKYSPEAFESARADGKRVFIKFTANWCANCQVNERIILASEAAVAELTEPDVAVFKVDFTGPNEDGDAKKEELGGGGIPLIAIYRPDDEAPLTLRGQLVDASPVVDGLRGTYEAADTGGQVFDFLGWQFSVGKDAVAIILVLAFIAGFLMNFTPCVLPVIPIKIISLQAHAKDPRRCLVLGLVFSAGIVALYAAIGLLMAGLVTGIDRLDWGDQFQNWWLNALIALVIAAMGIGMMGFFTISLPQWLYMFNPQSDTSSGSFFMGVFTAILSTPCTGPLLGATVAWTATQAPAVSLLTLVVMGLGMAFPYVVLTAFPKLLQRMPKTGPGSELLKQVMGLLMMAVAVYFGGTALAALAA